MNAHHVGFSLGCGDRTTRRSSPLLATVGYHLLLAALLLPAPLQAGSYSLVDVGVLPGHVSSSAVAINSAGQVIGTSVPSDAQGGNGRRRAFLFRDGRLIDLGVLAGDASEARGINSSGQVVGVVESRTGSRSFIHENGATRDLLGADVSTPFAACGINDAGEVVGTVFSSGQVQGYVFARGALTSIGSLGGTSCTPKALNAKGQVVGRATTRTGSTHAFVSEGGRMTDLGYLPGGSGYSVANAINRHGEIVGWSNIEQPGSAAVIYGNAAVIPLRTTAFGAEANAINSDGVIVGKVSSGPAASRAALFAGGRSTDLNSSIERAPGWVIYEAIAINDSGLIAGTATTPTGSTHAVLLVPNDLTAATPSRLTNLSIRSTAGVAAETLIVGFTLTGLGSKQLLVRGVGPTLAGFGVSGVLPDPTLRFERAGGELIAENEDWGQDPACAAAFVRAGAFALAPQSRDAALLASLGPGSFTAMIGGVSRAGVAAPGVALVELYDLGAAEPRLSNVSARTRVGSDAQVLTAGFTISGDGVKTVLVRATGPALIPFGVNDALPDPHLRIFDAGSVLIADNRDWVGLPVATASASVGAFPLTVGSRDAAVLITLPPGGYTAQISSQVGAVALSGGVALIEVYELSSGMSW